MQTALSQAWRRAILCLLSISIPAIPSAQDGISLGEPDRGVFDQPAAGISGILDPSKLDMSHSLSMQFSSSSRARPGGSTMGFYENRMSYQIADPLNLTLYLGYQFQPMADQSSGGGDLNQILPGFSLTYQPSENFLMHFRYQKLGSQSYNYTGFPNRHLFNPYQ